MKLVQSPAQVLSQLLVRTVLIDLALLFQSYEFSPEELAAVGLTPEVLDQLAAIIERLREMSSKDDPPPAPKLAE